MKWKYLKEVVIHYFTPKNSKESTQTIRQRLYFIHAQRGLLNAEWHFEAGENYEPLKMKEGRQS